MYGKSVLIIFSLLLLTCAGKRNTPLTNLALSLAMQDELGGSNEAVVWFYDEEGGAQTFWIKVDVTGVSTILSRRDLVIPTEGALWRFPDRLDMEDLDAIALTELVSGRTTHLVLDESFVPDDFDDPDDPDASVASEDMDAGLPAPEPVTPKPSKEAQDQGDEETDNSDCETRAIQSDLIILASVGPYLFLRFEEHTYDCTDALILAEDRFEVFDLRDGSRPDILTDAEVDALFEIESVRNLKKEGPVELVGIAPFYNPVFDLGLTYYFAVKQAYVADDGDKHSYTSTVEVLAREIPATLKPYAVSPSFVQAFGLMARGATPGGVWLVDGLEMDIAKQLIAFVPPREEGSEEDTE